MRKGMTRLLLVLAALSVPLFGSEAMQSNAAAERYVANAVNLGDIGRTGAGIVELVITRWSSDAEATRLLNVLEKKSDKLLDVLRDLPRVGYIRTPNSTGYDLHFARKEPLPDGGERVVLATDRDMSLWEQWVRPRPRTIDYPFTVIEMRIGANGEGEGRLSLATRIIPDYRNGVIALENYSKQPVLLTKVRKERE